MKPGKKKKAASVAGTLKPVDPNKPAGKKRGPKPKGLRGDVKTEPTVDDTKEYFWFPDAASGYVRDLTKLYQCERCCRGFKTVQEYRMHFHRWIFWLFKKMRYGIIRVGPYLQA